MPSTLKLSPKPTSKELERAYASGLLRPDELEHGQYYRGECRVNPVARWHAGVKRFFLVRCVRNERFLDEMAHPAQGRTHEVFLPLERTTPTEGQKIPDEMFDDS